jgi:hypothetical protein
MPISQTKGAYAPLLRSKTRYVSVDSFQICGKVRYKQIYTYAATT